MTPTAQVVDYALVLGYIPDRRWVILLVYDGTSRYWSDTDRWPNAFATEAEAQERVDFHVRTGQWLRAKPLPSPISSSL